MLRPAHDVNRPTTESKTAFAVDVSTARFSRFCCSITDGLCRPSPFWQILMGCFHRGLVRKFEGVACSAFRFLALKVLG
jgi:hypothetical protein